MAGLIILGDVSQAGNAADLDAAERELITPFRELFGICNKPVFVVPGNHDLKRQNWWKFRFRVKGHPNFFSLLSHRGNIRSSLSSAVLRFFRYTWKWTGWRAADFENPRHRLVADQWEKYIGPRFSDYHEWCVRNGFVTSKDVRARSWVHDASTDSFHYRFVGVNSAVASNGFNGNLSYSEWASYAQFYNLPQNQRTPSLLFMHHPLSDMDQADSIFKQIARDCFNVICHGHTHNSGNEFVHRTPVIKFPSLGHPAPGKHHKDVDNRDGLAFIRLYRDRMQVFYATLRHPHSEEDMQFVTHANNKRLRDPDIEIDLTERTT